MRTSSEGPSRWARMRAGVCGSLLVSLVRDGATGGFAVVEGFVQVVGGRVVS